MMHAPFSTSEIGNMYVADMTQHQFLDDGWQGSFEYLNAPAASGNSLYGAVTFASGDDVAVNVLVDPNGYGRNLRVTSTDAGAVSFYGFDYLNQPMMETITATAGTVEGKKAFKRVTRIVSGAVDGDISFGPGDEFGLPFVGAQVVHEFVNGAIGTDGTLTAPDVATPTATTGDPRGTYSPNSAADGSKDYTIVMVYTPGLPGGLYGQRHFGG